MKNDSLKDVLTVMAAECQPFRCCFEETFILWDAKNKLRTIFQSKSYTIWKEKLSQLGCFDETTKILSS